jgi:hypothetical protein
MQFIPQRSAMDCFTAAIASILEMPYEEVPFSPPVALVSMVDKVHMALVRSEKVLDLIAIGGANDRLKDYFGSDTWLDYWFPGNGLKLREYKRRPNKVSLCLVAVNQGEAHTLVSLGNGMYWNPAPRGTGTLHTGFPKHLYSMPLYYTIEESGA